MKLKIKEILNTIDHRPWSISFSKWKYYQEWNNALFLHWEIAPQLLRPYIPKEFTLDLFDGEAWISIVAFSMQNIRIRNTPPFPPISNFGEINIRTYIKYKNQAGVYFLSMEAEKMFSVFLSKKLSDLPYEHSQMSLKHTTYQSVNNKSNNNFKVNFEVLDNIKHPNKIDLWLTERYALFHKSNQEIITYQVHHTSWPLQEARIKEIQIYYPNFNTFINDTPDRIAYSSGTQVLAWSKQKTIV